MPSKVEQKLNLILDNLIKSILDGSFNLDAIKVVILHDANLDSLIRAFQARPEIAKKMKSLSLLGCKFAPQDSRDSVPQMLLAGNLSTFPDLNVFTNLESISITHTNIETISNKEIKSCKRIQKIDLSNNKISILPKDFLQYSTNLREFIFCNNLLTNVPKTFFVYTEGLQKVDFDGNKISEMNIQEMIEAIKDFYNLHETPGIILNSLEEIVQNHFANKSLKSNAKVKSLELASSRIKFDTSEKIDHYLNNAASYMMSGILYRLPSDCDLSKATSDQSKCIEKFRELWEKFDSNQILTINQLAHFANSHPELKKLVAPFKAKPLYQDRIYLDDVIQDMLKILSAAFAKYDLQSVYLDFLNRFAKHFAFIDRRNGRLEYYALNPGNTEYAFSKYLPNPGFGLFLLILEDLPTTIIDKYMPKFASMGFAEAKLYCDGNLIGDLADDSEIIVSIDAEGTHKSSSETRPVSKISPRAAMLSQSKKVRATESTFTSAECLDYAIFLKSNNKIKEAFDLLCNYVNNAFISAVKPYKVVIGVHMSLLLDCIFADPNLFEEGLSYLDNLCEKSSVIQREHKDWVFSPFIAEQGCAFKKYEHPGFGILDLALNEHNGKEARIILERCAGAGIKKASQYIQRSSFAADKVLFAIALETGRSNVSGDISIIKGKKYIVIRNMPYNNLEIQSIEDGSIGTAPEVFFSLPMPDPDWQSESEARLDREALKAEILREARQQFVLRDEFGRQQDLSKAEVKRILDDLNHSTQLFGGALEVLRKRVQKLNEIEIIREALNCKNDYSSVAFFDSVLNLIHQESIVATLVNSGRFKLDYGSKGTAIDGVVWIFNTTSAPGAILGGMVKFGFELYQSMRAKFKGKRTTYLTGTSNDAEKLAVHIATAILNCHGDLISKLSEEDAVELAKIYVRSVMKYITDFEASKRDFIVQNIIYAVLTGYELKLSRLQMSKYAGLIYEPGSIIPNKAWLEIILKDYANHDLASDSISANGSDPNLVPAILPPGDLYIVERPSARLMFSVRAKSMAAKMSEEFSHAASGVKSMNGRGKSFKY